MTKPTHLTGRWRLLRIQRPVVGTFDYVLQAETDDPTLKWRNAELKDISFEEFEKILQEGGSGE